MRLVLAANTAANPLANAIKPTGGVETALTTPSGQQSGLKMNVNLAVPAGQVADFAIDFDACKSFVKAGNSGKIPSEAGAVGDPDPVCCGPAHRRLRRSLAGIAPAPAVSAQLAGTPVRATPPDASGRFVLYPVPAGQLRPGDHRHRACQCRHDRRARWQCQFHRDWQRCRAHQHAVLGGKLPRVGHGHGQRQFARHRCRGASDAGPERRANDRGRLQRGRRQHGRLQHDACPPARRPGWPTSRARPRLRSSAMDRPRATTRSRPARPALQSRPAAITLTGDVTTNFVFPL